MTDDFLLLTTGKAAEYLSCSRDELIAWVKPDRRMPGRVGPGTEALVQTDPRSGKAPRRSVARPRSRRSSPTRCGNASQRRGRQGAPQGNAESQSSHIRQGMCEAGLFADGIESLAGLVTVVFRPTGKFSSPGCQKTSTQGLGCQRPLKLPGSGLANGEARTQRQNLSSGAGFVRLVDTHVVGHGLSQAVPR